jgi:FeS assembly protein IscX
MLSKKPTSNPTPSLSDDQPLTWDDSFAIALALRQANPGVNLEQVSLGMIYRWVLDLPNFDDDPVLANEKILEAIYLEWFEEENSL